MHSHKRMHDLPSVAKLLVFSLFATAIVSYLVFASIMPESMGYEHPEQLGIAPEDGLIVVNGGQSCVTSRDVALYLYATHATDVVVSHDPYFADQVWQQYRNPSPMDLSWRLPDKDGPHTIFAMYRSFTGDTSQVIATTVELDRTNDCK